MTTLRQAAQQALEALETLMLERGSIYETAITALREALARENAMHEVARLGQEIEQPEQEPCIGKDPRCPCQDGDACHYKDCGGTKALLVPVAQPAQEPVATLFGTLPVYDTPPAAQPEQEPVAWFSPSGALYRTRFHAVANGEQLLTPLYTTPPAAAQRPWHGLDEKNFSAINQSCLTKLQAATSAESILKDKNT